MENMIQFVIVHPQLQVKSSQSSMWKFQLYHTNCIVYTQLNTLVVEPSYLLDSGDTVNISITFNHSMVIYILPQLWLCMKVVIYFVQTSTGFVAYDVLVIVQLDGGATLSNLMLFSNSLEPNGCSSGNEVYTILEGSQVRLSHLLVTCDAKVTLVAQVIMASQLRTCDS